MTLSWKRLITGLSIALGLAATSGTASAGFNALKGATSPSLSSFDIHGRGTNLTAAAGTFNWVAMNLTYTQSVAVPGLTTQIGTDHVFRTFCIELIPFTGLQYHFIDRALQDLPTATLASPMGPGKANDLQQFFKQHETALRNILNPLTGSSTANNIFAAAVQLAIWEIVYEKTGTAYDVTSEGAAGQGFYVSASSGDKATAIAMANTLLGATDFTSGATIKVNGWEVQNTGSEQQDQITLPPGDYDDGLDPVPAPPALILALVGVVPCLALRRRLRGPAIA